MVKEKKSSRENIASHIGKLFILLGVSIVLFCIFLISFIYSFEKTYAKKIYPGVRVDGVSFGGKTKEEIEEYFAQKSLPFEKLQVTLQYEDTVATLSARELAVSFDGKLSAVQAYSVGRSGYRFSDIYQRFRAVTQGIFLSSVLKVNSEVIDEALSHFAENIDIPFEDATFQFGSGKVTLFRPSTIGRQVNKIEAKKQVMSSITTLPQKQPSASSVITLSLPVDAILPKITTENSNNFGIKDLLAKGDSKFAGSIPNRVRNIELAASRINGRLVAPGDTFSFNDALGDVSAATGFAPAYIIKEGRTVLGDGGGVCQVSTTLFRAILNAGLPIIERRAHAYRVAYYEQDSPPGLDATVFAPSVDLKFKNDTQNYILIQAKADTQNYTLRFELYGTDDGRKAEVTKPVILSQTSPPPDLYQDDPTLPKGVVKQVDWKAWGAKVNFDYKVTRNGEILRQESFFSQYQPWKAIFLRGTKE